MRSLNSQVLNCLENNDIFVIETSVQGDAYITELEFCSNLQEDVVLDIWYDGSTEDFVEQFTIYADNFDVDEHVEVLIPSRGKNGVPESISMLVKDAEEIKAFLESVGEELSKIKIKR